MCVNASVFACLCVRACGFSGSLARECACARVTLLTSLQSVCVVLYFHLWPAWLYHIFSTLSNKRNNF